MEDGEPNEFKGYILPDEHDVIIKLAGKNNDNEDVDEIIIVRQSDWDAGVTEIGAPAMISGTMDIFGIGNVVAAALSGDGDAFGDYGEILRPFYHMKYHIFSFNTGLNWYGLNIIQDDALLVKVKPDSDMGEQENILWVLNSYAVLNDGEYTMEVFFGNDDFTLSLPGNGIGAAQSFSITAEESPGYEIMSNGGGTWSIDFKSDFYDTIELDVQFILRNGGGQATGKLVIRRVGVSISTMMGKLRQPRYNTQLCD